MHFSFRLTSTYLLICCSHTCLARRRLLREFKHGVFDYPSHLVPAHLTGAPMITPEPGYCTPTGTVLTLITPSPGALPVEVTSQSQVVTTYVPEFTMCVGQPVGMYPLLAMGPPYRNQSAVFGTTVGSTTSCSTQYVTAETTVCATTLTGIASKITVSECDQEITFSSEFGYRLETPSPTLSNGSEITPTPTLKRKVTYYAAPWQSIIPGQPPSQIDTKVCTILDDGLLECVHYVEVWQVNVVIVTSTTTSHIDLTTKVSRPGVIMVESIHITITSSYESISLSTSMLLETETEIETTSKSRSLVTRPVEVTGPTIYVTRTVQYASSKSEEPTTTLTETLFTTVLVGTVTRTSPALLPTAF